MAILGHMTNRHRRIALSADLVARLRTRDEAAYRELFEQTWSALFGVAAAVVQSRDIAEDVVQNVLIRLWRQGEQLAPHGELGDYLIAAVRNAALTALRDDKRLLERHDRFSATLALHDDIPGAAAAANTGWDEELAKLRRVLAGLTEHQRTAFALRYGQGMTNAEIARTLGISLKGAEQLTARLKKLLRERLLDPLV